MKKIFSSSLLMIILMTALLFSCKKDISKIGVDVVGANPLKVVYMDTVTIKAYSELIDSLRTDELSAHVLGAYKDPVFGTLNASIYSQFRLVGGFEDYDFGTNPVIDSVRLYIKYSDTDVYGDTNYMQNLTVYELGEDMLRDTFYYSFQNLRTKYDILGQTSFIPVFDSVQYIDGEDTLQKLRPITIPLANEFGTRLLMLDTLAYSSNEEFLKEFKGIYITTLDQNLPSFGGSLVNTNFDDDETYINLFYHNDEADSLEFKLATDFSTARFSNFNHYDYQDADPLFYQQVVEGDTTLGEQKLYMQGLAGVRTVIEFPYLHKMSDYYNYAVNEAKLFVHDMDETSILSPISSLTISQKYAVDSISYDYYLIEDASGGDRYFSGDYNSTDKRYYFRITQYLQSLIKGNTVDNKIRLEMVGGAVHPNRLVAGGTNPMGLEDKRIYLQVIYTKIDED